MIEALCELARAKLVFPKGLPKLRGGLSEHYFTNYGVRVAVENIFVDAGTSSVFRNIFHQQSA